MRPETGHTDRKREITKRALEFVSKAQSGRARTNAYNPHRALMMDSVNSLIEFWFFHAEAPPPQAEMEYMTGMPTLKRNLVV